MLLVGGFHVVDGEGEVELIVSQIVMILVPIAKSGQFQLMGRLAVAQIDKDERAVSGFLSPDFLEPERFLMELE